MDMKLKIEAPELVSAIEKLAAVLPSIRTITAQNPNTAPKATAPATECVPAPAVNAPECAPVLAAGAPVVSAASTIVPAPTVPVTTAPAYTMDQISKAGASLVDAGKMEQLLALLGKYGIQAITQLQPDQYGVFATELRTLGAQI